MSKQKFEWKFPAIIWGGWLILLVIAKLVTTSDNYKVVHTAAVSTEVGTDGRAAVGSPEGYTVWISPSTAHEIRSQSMKVFGTLAWVFFIAAGIFLLAGANDVITFEAGSKAGNYALIFLMGIGVVMTFAGYSSIVADTSVTLTSDQYNAVKDSKDALRALFVK